MCTILKFAPSTDSGAQRESCGQRKKAEIILFPGVRYERVGNDNAVEPRERQSHRDYLVL